LPPAARAGIAVLVTSAATNTTPASMVPESKARRRDAGPRARRAKRRTASAGCVIPAASARAGDACLDRCDPATPRSLLIAAAMPRAAFARGNSPTPDADRFSVGLIPTADDIEGYRHDQSSGLAASANFIRCDMNVAASTISHSIGGILPSDVARIEQRLVAAHGRRSGSK
jgi:hypothetical protein